MRELLILGALVFVFGCRGDGWTKCEERMIVHYDDDAPAYFPGGSSYKIEGGILHVKNGDSGETASAPLAGKSVQCID